MLLDIALQLLSAASDMAQLIALYVVLVAK